MNRSEAFFTRRRPLSRAANEALPQVGAGDRQHRFDAAVFVIRPRVPAAPRGFVTRGMGVVTQGVARDPNHRHCERSEAIPGGLRPLWIASPPSQCSENANPTPPPFGEGQRDLRTCTVFAAGGGRWSGLNYVSP